MTEHATRTGTGTGSGSPGNLLLEVSNALVGIHKEYYGRGPTKARTYISDDLVVVVLQGGYSKVEQTLVETGRLDSVLHTRLTMQETVEETSREHIERLTGRRVRSFMSGNDPNQELQAEIFLLEPEDAEPRPSDTHSHDEAADLSERAKAARDEAESVREDHRALRAEQSQARSALEQQRHECEERRKG